MTFHAVGFIETATFTANYVLRHKDKLENGILRLRDVKDGEDEPTDLPILREWKSARSLLTRLRAGAAGYFNGVTPDLGKVWIEALPPLSGTPWEAELGDYSDGHVRTRTCLIPSPGATSYCGGSTASLLVGIVTALDMKLLCSETNHGDHTRVHLVADVKVPDVAAPDLDS